MRQTQLLPLLILSLLSSCTFFQTSTVDEKILAADRTVTAVLLATDSALNAHLITPAQAKSVSAITHQVIPLLDSAKAASDAADTAGADKTMTLVNSLLAGLKAYVPPPPKTT